MIAVAWRAHFSRFLLDWMPIHNAETLEASHLLHHLKEAHNIKGHCQWTFRPEDHSSNFYLCQQHSCSHVCFSIFSYCDSQAPFQKKTLTRLACSKMVSAEFAAAVILGIIQIMVVIFGLWQNYVLRNHMHDD
jgi:hypothetical protein